MILYKSTRGDNRLYKFSEIILKGIAPDGGLFVPAKIPKIPKKDFPSLMGKSYQELCFYLINLFETDFSKDLLRKIILRAYSNNFDHPQVAPLIHLKDQQYILELWHGPTSAFKDIALQLTAYLFSESLKRESRKRQKIGKKALNYLILVATSGDTGKAAMDGYRDKEGISIAVFYPYKGVSHLQELSMITQEGENVCVYGMRGDFDEVQRSVKETFNDKKFNQKLLQEKNTVLSSANSINWGRLFPQIIYHVKSYLDLVSKKVIRSGDEIDIAVPTGNFGNILSAYYAKIMGIPIRKLICATNDNNVYTQFLKTGIYDVRGRKLVKTPSPAMNILIGSNLERLLYELTHDSKKVIAWMKKLSEEKYCIVDEHTLKKFKKHFYADWVSNNDCLSAIKRVYGESKYLIDPHTAVAQEAAERYKRKFSDTVPVVICATAHWSKFPNDVYRTLKGYRTNKDEFALIQAIKTMDPKIHVPQNILDLENKKIRHTGRCKVGKKEAEKNILQYLSR